MGITDRKKERNDGAGETSRAAVFLQNLGKNDEEILLRLEVLQQKLDSMDKANKKFLMAATMNDGRSEALEKENLTLKKGIISLLDQFDVLIQAIYSSDADSLKGGLASSYDEITRIIAGLGLEEIPVESGAAFNSNEQECVETVHLEGKEDDTVADYLQRGYRDINTGNILRYAKVTVNKL